MKHPVIPVFIFSVWFAPFARMALKALVFSNSPETAFALSTGAALIMAAAGIFLVLTSEPKALIAPRPILYYLAWCAISLLWTQAEMARAVGHLAAVCLDLIAVACCLKIAKFRDVLRWSLFGIMSSAILVAAVSLFAGGAEDSRLGDATVLQPNYIGYIFAIGVIAAVYLWKEYGAKTLPWAALLFFALLLTVSKTSILATMIAGGFLLRDRIDIKKLAAASVVILAVLALAAPYLGQAVDSDNGTPSAFTLTGRTVLWASLLQTIEDHPVIGTGYGSFEQIVDNVWPGAYIPPHAHNELLQQETTLGLAGVGLSTWIYASVWKARLFDQGMLAAVFLILFVISGVAEADPFGTLLPLPYALLLTARLRIPIRQLRESGISAPLELESRSHRP